MIESIVAYSIRNRMTVGMLVLFIIGWGLFAVSQLPIDAVPDITNNQVQVVTTSTSLAPQEVEKFITHPIELVLRNLPDVVEMRSISRYGLSIVTIVFQDKMPILHARQLVQEQLNMVNIPENLGLPELMPITTGLGEIYQYTIEVEKGFEDRYSLMDLREIQDWIVKRRLSGIPGIIEIGSYGGLLKQYEVAVDPERLMLFDLSLGQVVESLGKNNQNAGGAYIEKGDLAIYIRSEGLIQSTDDIAEILVEDRNGTPIRIKDVGEVRFGHATRYGAMTKNGKGEAVGGIAYMLKGANSLETVRKVKERVEELNKIMPPGTRIEPYLDRSDLIERAITTVRNNLTEGALIVILC
jgi:heavy metal efflux system protein